MNDVVAFVATQQARRDRRVTYVGTSAAGIAAELAGLKPPWETTLRTREADGRLTGVVIVEWDEELGRSWILGPWVDPDDAAVGADLLDAALAQLPPTVTRHEMSGDVGNPHLAALADARGWTTSEPNHLFVVDASVAATWPPATGLRAATAADVAAIAPLHDGEFPDTYATAPQLVEGPAVVLVADDGAGFGYAAGQVHEDGEGFIDFVVVAPAARRSGFGRRLVVGLTQALLDQAPAGQVALLVQDHRAPARALYEHLGFRLQESVVGYRSWT